MMIKKKVVFMNKKIKNKKKSGIFLYKVKPNSVQRMTNKMIILLISILFTL